MDRIPESEVMDDYQEARVYDLADFEQVNQDFADQFVRRVRSPQLRIIDLGTGPADIPIKIWQALRHCRIVAVDASAAMLDRAARRVAAARADRAVALLRADANHLPLPDASFEAVVSNSLLHHLGDPLGFWREVRRVVGPGGIVYVEDLYRPQTTRQAARIVETHSPDEPQLLKDLFYQSLLAAFTVEEVRDQLGAAGLGEIDVSAIDDRHLAAWGYAR